VRSIAVVLYVACAVLSAYCGLAAVAAAYDGMTSMLNPWLLYGAGGALVFLCQAGVAWSRAPGAAATAWVVLVAASPFCGWLGILSNTEAGLDAGWLTVIVLGSVALATAAVLLTVDARRTG
jgi:hypothetical protein